MTTKNPSPNPASPFASWTVDHVGLRTSDFEAAVAWYQTNLDFRLISSWEIADMKFGFLSPAQDDKTRIELISAPNIQDKSPDPSVGFTVSGWHHLCLHVNDVDETVAELKRRGVLIVVEPREVKDIGIKFALFSDPWANIFEVLQEIG